MERKPEVAGESMEIEHESPNKMAPAWSSQEHLLTLLEIGRCAAPSVRLDSGFTSVKH